MFRLEFIRKFSLILAIGLLFGLVGYKLGTNQVKVSWQNFSPHVAVVNKLAPSGNPVDFSLFWSVWDELENKYVDKSKLDTQKMVYGAISGMVAAIGDPYTVFLPPTANEQTKDSLNGTFDGVGAELGVKDNKTVVIAPLPDSPAQKAGIKTADWIIKVNGQDISALTLPEVVNLIRGPKGTKVTLNVLHSGGSQSVDVVVTRDTIILQSVSWKVINKSVVYLNLARFGDQTDLQWDTTVSQIADYLATSSAKPVGLVLDVRNNPGGLLDGAVYTASEFLPSGVVVTQQGTTGNETFSVNRTGKLLSVPMVVLVNGGTASAGEILAGALQAAGRAKLVGDQTFGKGSVQQAEDLPDGTGLHVTVAKWLLSNGNWINGKGLTPDVKVENNSADPTQDLQLDKAVQVILSPSS